MARNAAAQTAFGPMVLAAVEHHEASDRRLVDDDLAASFLPGRLRALVAAARWKPLRNSMIAASERSAPGIWASTTCRKRLIDDRLSDPFNEFDTVVVLGAGLDTRGCRIARHGALPVFEVDQPINTERKAAAIRRALGELPPSVRLVAVDFEHDDLMDRLREQGYDPAQRTFFVWEGVTQYLTRDAVRATLAQLRSAAPGSHLLFSYVRQDFIDGTNMYGAQSVYRKFRQRNQVWLTGFNPESMAEFIGEFGWRLTEQAGPSYYRDTYIKPTGRRLVASPIEWLAHAVRS